MRVVGWTAAETARQLKLSRSAVSQILSGKNTPSAQTLQLLRLAVLNKETKPADSYVMNDKAGRGLRPIEPVKEQAPVISWASAGYGTVYDDLGGFMDEYVETDCRDPNKYALIVEGDSMEPIFRPGDRIVIAPNEQPQNGDIVVARLVEKGEVLFKLYHETSTGQVRLTSYNANLYPAIDRKKTEFRFIHPVYQMTRRTLKRGGRK